MTDWEQEVRWARAQRAGDDDGWPRWIIRTALILSLSVNAVLFLLLVFVLPHAH